MGFAGPPVELVDGPTDGQLPDVTTLTAEERADGTPLIKAAPAPVTTRIFP
ncbi:hypothetical protein [Streptomyces pratensis]|uniref:hypothetical protein n=1 Tax=Streptomyces pratensis TaxID=1169025 RepID=UPI0030180C70